MFASDRFSSLMHPRLAQAYLWLAVLACIFTARLIWVGIRAYREDDVSGVLEKGKELSVWLSLALFSLLLRNVVDPAIDDAARLREEVRFLAMVLLVAASVSAWMDRYLLCKIFFFLTACACAFHFLLGEPTLLSFVLSLPGRSTAAGWAEALSIVSFVYYALKLKDRWFPR